MRPETMHQRATTEPATLTLRSGSAGFRVVLANLRKNWPAMIALVLGWGGYQYRNNGSLSETLTTLGWLLGALVVVMVLFHLLYSRSTVELTRDELVVTRMFVRQRLPRAEVAELVRGSSSGLRTSAVRAYYWFITDSRGERFVALPSWLFPENGFEDLAGALGVKARPVADPAEERRLSPWWMKSVWLTAILTLLVLVIVGGLVWWAVVAVQDWRHARAESAAQSAVVAQIEEQLTTSRHPHLKRIAHDVPTSPLRVSASAETTSEVRLRSTIDLAGSGPEMPAEEVIDLLDLQCSASRSGAEVTQATVTYEADGALGQDRVVTLECDADAAELESWIRWSEEHPAGARSGDVDVSQEMFDLDGEQLDLAVAAYTPDATDESFRAAMEHACGYPGADGLTIDVRDEDHTRSAIRVDCDDIEGELAD